MIPNKELPEDVQFYKGELMSNALLNQAGKIAAQKKRLLSPSTTLSDQEVVDRIKPIGTALRRATKKLRQLPGPSAAGVSGPNEDTGTEDDLVTTALEKWMKRVIQNTEIPTTPRPLATPRKRRRPPTPFQVPPTASSAPKRQRYVPPTPPSGRRDFPYKTPKQQSIFPTPPSTTPSSSRIPRPVTSKKKGFMKELLESAVEGALGGQSSTPTTTRSVSRHPRKKGFMRELLESAVDGAVGGIGSGGIKSQGTPKMLKRIRPSRGWQAF